MPQLNPDWHVVGDPSRRFEGHQSFHVRHENVALRRFAAAAHLPRHLSFRLRFSIYLSSDACFVFSVDLVSRRHVPILVLPSLLSPCNPSWTARESGFPCTSPRRIYFHLGSLASSAGEARVCALASVLVRCSASAIPSTMGLLPGSNPCKDRSKPETDLQSIRNRPSFRKGEHRPGGLRCVSNPASKPKFVGDIPRGDGGFQIVLLGSSTVPRGRGVERSLDRRHERRRARAHRW